jgi:hypothetical protein
MRGRSLAVLLFAVSRMAAAQGARVEFTVADSSGRGLSGVTVDVADATGARRSLVTTEDGQTLAATLAVGRVTVIARRIGYTLGKLDVVVDTGLNVVPIVMSESAPPMLDTVRIVGAQPLLGLHRNDEFDVRRARKLATVSFDQNDIERRNPVDISQLLRGILSVQLIDSGRVGGVMAMSTRAGLLSNSNARPCFLRVMVDGNVLNPQGDPFDLRHLPSPREIYGMEVFAGPASVPLQYGGGSEKWCGLIAVWTK